MEQNFQMDVYSIILDNWLMGHTLEEQELTSFVMLDITELDHITGVVWNLEPGHLSYQDVNPVKIR